jgi:predicted nucleic acid-binding protein
VNGYLVDTNIPSELTRLKPEPRVAAFLRQAAQERLYVSTLTFGEICNGIGKLRPEATAKRLSLQL